MLQTYNLNNIFDIYPVFVTNKDSFTCMIVLHAPEFNLFYHLKNYQNVFKELDLILTH